MFNMPNAPIRLAYWQDEFTVLSVKWRQVPKLDQQIVQLLLYCRGQHALAYLRQAQTPQEGVPRPGNRVAATLRIGSLPGSWRLHVQAIKQLGQR